MAFLYDRKETDKEITIVYKYQAAYYIILFALIFIPLKEPFLVFFFLPALFVVMCIQIAGKWKPNQEIKRAMKKGHVKVSGNKFSFKNPLTITIEK